MTLFQVRPISAELEESECDNLDVVDEFSQGLDAVMCKPDVHFIRFVSLLVYCLSVNLMICLDLTS